MDMDIEAYVQSLSLPLPEDILKRKWAGDLAGAARAIDIRLAHSGLPAMLRLRLLCEKERLRRLPTQYPWDRTQALAKLRELAPDVSEEAFDRLELEGRVDFIYIGGEKRYFVRFHRTLLKTLALDGQAPSPDSPWLDPMIARIKQEGALARRITLETSLSLAADRFMPGEYLAFLPFPAASAQQSDIRLLEGDPDIIAPADALARTACWHRQLAQWQDFRLKYRYVSRIRYADPLHQPAPATPLYPHALPATAADLAEELPFIRFTPYLRALAADVTAGEATPVGKAWRIYEFVTTNVQYSFMRDYFQIDDLGEYCAVNLKGDCGLQALLFINLCRIAGIPARWQSGLSIDARWAGSHDWAQFYLEGWGWLFADPSYGGGAHRSGSAERHAFYFGNIDPLRMAANRCFQAPLSPAMHALRVDPYDNQSGELERVGAPLPFTGRDLDGEGILVDYADV